MKSLEKIFDSTELAEELKRESKSLNLPPGSTEEVINSVMDGVNRWLENKNTITKNDLERVVSRELDKYNADFAYIYRHRDKII